MPSVDFTAWVEPNLQVTLGGADYSVPPPSVDRARIILALTTLSEVRLGLVQGPPDPELVALAEALTDPLPVVTLGRAVYDAMVSDGVSATSIDRVGYYAMYYWAHGKERADQLATLMWSPTTDEPGDVAPKARRRSKSGPSSASVNRTRTASTPTTGSRRT